MKWFCGLCLLAVALIALLHMRSDWNFDRVNVRFGHVSIGAASQIGQLFVTGAWTSGAGYAFDRVTSPVDRPIEMWATDTPYFASLHRTPLGGFVGFTHWSAATVLAALAAIGWGVNGYRRGKRLKSPPPSGFSVSTA